MKLTYQEALEATKTLLVLDGMDLPVKSSINVARLSNLVNAELKNFMKIRDKLMKDYQVLPDHSGKDNIMSFSCGAETKPLQEKQLKEFIVRFQELLATETPEWDIGMITLPASVKIKPRLLKPIAQLVEVE